MITLYAFGSAMGLPDPSPFVMKAEMLLKLSELPYRIDIKGFPRAPKGKQPYIEDNGKLIADSTFIRWHLEKVHLIQFDQHLTTEQTGIAWAVEKLLEDNLYWVLVYTRWCIDENFHKGPAHFFDRIPWPMRAFVKKMIRRKVNKGLYAQGMGRHNDNEITQIIEKGVSSIAAILEDKPFLFGDKPCSADATLFAFIASFLCEHFDNSSLFHITKSHTNLVAYNNRMFNGYYPDFTRRPL